MRTAYTIIQLIFCNSCDLPDDVFAEGEVKPMRASKKKPVKNGSGKVAPNNKRASNDVRLPLPMLVLELWMQPETILKKELLQAFYRAI